MRPLPVSVRGLWKYLSGNRLWKRLAAYKFLSEEITCVHRTTYLRAIRFFTLPFECRDPPLTLHILLWRQHQRRSRGELYLCEWISRHCGVWACRFDGEVSVILSVLLCVLLTLRHISAWKTAYQRKTLTLQVFISFHCFVVVVPVLKNITVMVSPPDRDFRELSPREQPSSPRVRVSDSVLFSHSDYVTISFRAKQVTWSLFSMLGESGSQSQHIITASVWL